MYEAKSGRDINSTSLRIPLEKQQLGNPHLSLIFSHGSSRTHFSRQNGAPPSACGSRHTQQPPFTTTTIAKLEERVSLEVSERWKRQRRQPPAVRERLDCSGETAATARPRTTTAATTCSCSPGAAAAAAAALPSFQDDDDDGEEEDEDGQGGVADDFLIRNR